MKWFTKIFSESTEEGNTSGELNAFLGAGTKFTGQLTFEGSVRIDGHFLGSIVATGTLILGRDALVKGEVDVASLNVNGTLVGTVRVSRHANLHEHAVFDGRLITPDLSMDPGAIINGSIEMPNPNPRPEPAEGQDEASAPGCPCAEEREASEPDSEDLG